MPGSWQQCSNVLMTADRQPYKAPKSSTSSIFISAVQHLWFVTVMVGEYRQNDHQVQRTAKEMVGSFIKTSLMWLQASSDLVNIQAVAMQRSCLLFVRTVCNEGHAGQCLAASSSCLLCYKLPVCMPFCLLISATVRQAAILPELLL